MKTGSRMYLSHGSWACIRGNGIGGGVNLHSEAEEDSTTVEDSFTQTLVQSLEQRDG